MPPKQLTKQNSTKAQRRAANGLPPKPQPNVPRTRSRNTARIIRNALPRGSAHTALGRSGDSALLYRHCVLGPVAMPSMNVGYPDGDNRPTVTMDYRRTYTMAPNSNGEISFGVGTSYYGCFIKGRGTMATSVAFKPAAVLANGTVNIGTATTTLSDGSSGLVPILDPSNTNAQIFPAYRPIVAVAEITFTGSSMQNGGAVVVGKTSTASSVINTFGSSVNTLSYESKLAEPAMTGSSVVGAARDTYVSRVVPADPEFLPVQQVATASAATTTALVVNGLVSAGQYNSADRRMYSVPNVQAGAIWYSYSGLDSSATVTVNVRYCVQYSVGGDSPFVPIAKPSPPPPENPGILGRMFSAITSSPAALQFAANTVGHLLPATKPFLAIAADAYNAH